MRRKNIMMVLLDGCRAKSVGCLGYRARETTPVIDRLAERGTVVERLYSTSNCTMPSVISMFTGVYPALHRATPTWGYYDGKYPYLPQILREHGYQTFFAANAIAAMSPEWGFIRGYDRAYRAGREHNWFKESAEQARGVRKNSFKVQLQKDLFRLGRRYFPDQAERARMNASLNWYAQNDMGGAKAVACVGRMLKERDKERPFFMYVNLPDTHHPYLAPEPFTSLWGKPDVTRNLLYLNLAPNEFFEQDCDLNESEKATLVQMYDGCVRYVDHCVGRIVEVLEQSGLLDSTIIVLVGDHGGMTYEKKRFCGSTNFTYEPEIRVPLIIAYGDTGRKVGGLRSVIDLFPAMLELSDIRVPYGHAQGRSVLSESSGHQAIVVDYPRWPQWLAEMVKDRSTIIRSWQANRTLVKADGRKLIWLDHGNHEVYDLESDPDESANLYDSAASLPAVEELEQFYVGMLGPKGKRLEIYDHADIGRGMANLPPISVVNPKFDPASIVSV